MAAHRSCHDVTPTSSHHRGYLASILLHPGPPTWARSSSFRRQWRADRRRCRMDGVVSPSRPGCDPDPGPVGAAAAQLERAEFVGGPAGVHARRAAGRESYASPLSHQPHHRDRALARRPALARGEHFTRQHHQCMRRQEQYRPQHGQPADHSQSAPPPQAPCSKLSGSGASTSVWTGRSLKRRCSEWPSSGH